MWKARLRGNQKKGMTLVEMMVSIGIIAVLVAIAIPSIIGMRRSLQFKKMNEYAKEVFLAAQNTLVERNAAGTLDVLRANPDDGTLPAGAAVVPEIDNANFPAEDWSAQYCYTVTGTDAFELLLPAGSIDETVRSQNILVEYNPYTGNVYSVFYSESNALNYSNVTRDKTLRRKAMLGYYAGSGLSGGDALRDLTQPVVDLTTKGQEAILTVSVPIPDNYLADAHTFANAMRVSALIEGEFFGGEFEITAEQFGEVQVITGNTAQVGFVLDSLKNQGSFASLAQNNRADAKARNLGNIQDATSFNILPGDNVTITVSITIEGLPNVIEYSDVIVSGLNPMFGAVQEVIDTTGGTETVQYDIYLENGRHLQNLNAIAPQIADKVKSVYFSEDIYWNETQDYYTNKYVTQSAAAAAIAAGQSVAYKNSADELPGRGLPYFVPITSPNLFGSAYFDTNRNDVINNIIFSWGVDVPVLLDTDALSGEGAEVFGGNHKVLYLDINASKTNIVKADYYAYRNASNASIANVGLDRFTGLFSYCESNISSLYVVNSTIIGTNANTGAPIDTSATGGMVGACGPYAFLYDCGIYIDTEDPYFSRTNMGSYRVEGKNAVGGLVGYAKTHKSVSGELMTNSEDVLAFSQCFAAVPVRGGMARTGTDAAYGYTNGVGGIVGVSILSNFYNCYASGDVYATGVYTPGNLFQFLGEVFDLGGIWSRGVGGFVGTSHGTHYKNCFTTGDVEGDNTNLLKDNTNGAGGFIGVAYLDEEFTYGSETTVSQRTEFRSCYATGVAAIHNGNNNKKGNSENFCGRMLAFTDKGGLLEGAKNYIADYFDLDAGSYYTQGSYILFDLNSYIYKDCYYLNQYVAVEENWNSQSNLCAQVVKYQDLQDLYSYQCDVLWNKAKDNPGYQYSIWPSVRKQYYIHSRMDSFLNGFHPDNWHNRDDDNFVSHPYSLNIGNTYPFTKLKGMDYYGDWPSYMPNLGLAYYEEYEEGYVDGKPVVTTGYYLDRDRTSTLKNGTEENKNYTVVRDGYAILCSGEVTDNVVINGKPFTWSDMLVAAGSETIGNVRYNVYKLKPAAMAAAAEPDSKDEGPVQEFYATLKISTKLRNGAKTDFTVYFNPRFALTQVNPTAAVGEEQANNAEEPQNLPNKIYIRTARQLREIGLNDKYWGENYHYAQLVDIDADSYDWKTSLGLAEGQTVTFKPIGSVTAEGETAFQGSYNGGAGYVESARISNVDLDIAEGQLAYGLFGLIGANGSVSSVTLDVDKAPASITPTDPTTSIQLTTSVENMGMLAGVNRGEISAVTIAADNALTVTAQEAASISNFGMLAGTNNGSITGCTVSAPKPIQANVTNAMGGLVGVNAAAQSDSAVASAIDGCTVTIDTIENTNASTAGFTGGIVGKLEGGTFNAIVPTAPTEPTDPAAPTEPSEPTDPAEPVETTMPITIGNVTGNGYVGGFAGFASGNPGSIEAVQINKVTGAAAGGVIGKAEDLTLSGSDVTVKGQIEGQTYAGGFAAQVTKSGSAASAASDLKNCNITLEGPVTATADDGTAAGFAAELKAAVKDSGVFCRGTDKVTIKGNKAAGFAGNAHVVRSSSFSGKANIEGKTYAAGFANQINTAQGNVVAPVLMDSQDLAEAFRGDSNDNLKISAPNAAGFVNTVPENAEVSENAALGTITGKNAAGFAGSNNGIIARCMANVTVSGGVGFVAENTENVEACYVWYAGEGVKNSFVSANTGTVNGCYAAPLGAAATFTPAESTGTFTNCYNVCSKETASPIEGIHNTHFENMVGVGASQLGGKDLGWANADVAKKYPYDATLSDKPYSFPMLLKVPQYGNWKNGPIYAYGVVYYEEYDDGTLGYQIVELSDPNITEEKVSLSRDLPDSESDVDKVVTNYGYGVFYRKSSQITVMQGDSKVTLNEESNENIKPAELKDYVFKVISENASCVAERTVKDSLPVFTISGANDTAEVNPYFASAIKVNPDKSKTNEQFHIHAPQQLQNVAGFPNKNFEIHRKLDMSGMDDFVAIDKFSGSLTALNGAEITGFTGGSLFGAVNGAKINNLTLKNFNTTGSLFGTVNNATIQDVTVVKAAVTITDPQSVAGLFANTITGSSLIENCQILGLESEDTRIEPSTLTVTGKDTKIAVGILAGQVLNTTDESVEINDESVEINDVTIENVEVKFTQSESATKEANGDAYVGGAIGYANGGSYNNISAAVDMDIPDSAIAGQFVGYIVKGAFTKCSGLESNSDRYFLGDMEYEELTDPVTEEPYYRYLGNSTDDIISITDKQDPADFFTTAVRYKATLSNCQYQSKSDGLKTQQIQTRYCYKDIGYTTIPSYNHEKVEPGYTTSPGLSTDTIRKYLPNGQWTTSHERIAGHYLLLNDSYVEAYGWIVQGRWSYEYNVGTESGTSVWKCKSYETKSCGILCTVNLGKDTTYMVRSGGFALSKDHGFVSLSGLSDNEPWYLGEEFLLTLDYPNKFTVNNTSCSVIIEDGTFKITVGGDTRSVDIYMLTKLDTSQTFHRFQKTTTECHVLNPDPYANSLSMMDIDELIFRPAEPVTEPTEPETKPTEPETKPTEEETKPTEEETKPTEEETKPTEEETKPTEEETKPTEEETKPTEEETDPTEKETEPKETKTAEGDTPPTPQSVGDPSELETA